MNHLITCGIESLRQLIHLVAKRCVISRYIAYMEICACASVCLNVLKRCIISAFFTLGNVQIPNCKKQSPILSWEILHIPTHGLTDMPTFRQSVGRVRYSSHIYIYWYITKGRWPRITNMRFILWNKDMIIMTIIAIFHFIITAHWIFSGEIITRRSCSI